MPRPPSSLPQQRRDGLDVHRLRSPALVDLDWTTTFTPSCWARTSTSAWRWPTKWTCRCRSRGTHQVLQIHMGDTIAQRNPEESLAKDLAALMETMAQDSLIKVQKPEQERPRTRLEFLLRTLSLSKHHVELRAVFRSTGMRFPAPVHSSTNTSAVFSGDHDVSVLRTLSPQPPPCRRCERCRAPQR